MKSLMAAAHAAGYAMAPEDIYDYEDTHEQLLAQPVTTALVPVATRGIEMNIVAHARTLTSRWFGAGWALPRLTA